MEGQGWTAAELLKAGDVVRFESGENAIIDSVEVVALSKYVKVYNFEVEDFHTYYVSDDDVLVHNSCKVDILRNGKKGTTVTVGSKKEANSLLNKAFPDYQKVAGVGPQDASGFRKAAKMRAFAKGGTYHKDYAMEVVDGIKKVRGHDIADPHSLLPHINIKRRDGVKVAILISNGK